MKNLFESFGNSNTEVTSKDAAMNPNITFYGVFTIVKGGLSQELSFYAQVSMTQYKGYASFEDWEINDRSEASFNGIPIDSLYDLKSTLRSSGLKSIADSLDISSADERLQLASQISKDKTFNKVFGKATTMFELLTDDERLIIQLSFQIEKGKDAYELLSPGCHFLKRYVKVDEDGVKTKPTFEEIVVILDELKANQK
jgi:hypothetical protein